MKEHLQLKGKRANKFQDYLQLTVKERERRKARKQASKLHYHMKIRNKEQANKLKWILAGKKERNGKQNARK